MKQLNTGLLIFLLPLLAMAATSEIELGQSVEKTMHILGNPIGTLQLGSKTILMYPQGDITFREGRVSEIDLLTDAEFAVKQERQRLEREEWLIRQEKLAVERFKKGTELKAAKLQSNTFATLPAKQRVNYWRSFQSRYPEVDVAEQLASALKDRQIELAAEQTQKRIAELEARIARAEQAAAKAQDENERLRNQISVQNNAYQHWYPYYTRPYEICYPKRKVVARSDRNKAARHDHANRHPNHSKNRNYACSDR